MYNPIHNVLEDKGTTVHTIERHATVAEAVEKMNRFHIGALVVVFRDRPVGMFSERDVLVRVVAAARDPVTTWVSEVMTDGLVSIGPGTTVEEAMAVVTQRRCRHLPVVEDGRLLGLVSIGDLTRWVVRDKESTINDLVGFITGR